MASDEKTTPSTFHRNPLFMTNVILVVIFTIACIKEAVNRQRNIHFRNQSLFQSNQTILSLIQNEHNYINKSITQLPDAIIHLIQKNYNYMNKSIKRLNTNSNKYANRPVMNNPRPRAMKKFHRLFKPYMNSIQSFPVNQKLMLPNNVSFFIIESIGQGAQGQIFLVNISASYYALKLFRQHTWRNAPREYTTLKTIGEYCTYFNMSHSLLNIPFIHPTIPGYIIPGEKNINKQPRFFFLRAILNPMKWSELMNPQENNKLLSSIVHKGININWFFISCYRDIMNAIYALYDIKVFHNDFAESNILINYKTLKCYLIDLGKMFYKKLTFYSYENYKCRVNTCSPLGHYYLTSLKQRKNFTKYYNENNWPKIIGENALYMLSEFAMYDKQYQITSMILEGFIQLNYPQNSSLARINNEIYALRLQPGGMDSIWCKRLKLLTLLRKDQTKIYNKLWELLSIFENDWMFVNKSLCVS